MTRSASVVLLALLLCAAPLAQAAGDSAGSIIIPAGSDLELVNTRIIWMKSAQAGATLYLQVSESLKIDGIAAIPAGAYMQATLLALTIPSKKKNDEATLHIRYDKLIFPNGYTVVLTQPAPLARVTILVDWNNDILLDNGMWLHMQLPASLKLDADQVLHASMLSRAPGSFKPGTLCRGLPAGSSTPSGESSGGPMPDLIIPGTAGTPDYSMQIGPNGIGGSTTVAGMPGTPDQIIPSHSGYLDDDPGKPIICAAPPSIRSTVPESSVSESSTRETAQSPLQALVVTAQPLPSALTLPAGTSIPLMLSQPVTRKSSKTGSTVSATVAFPATVGSQIAIPVGTKVEGTIKAFRSSDVRTRQPVAAIRFTRLVYPNGYIVTLDTPGTAELAAPVVPFPIAALTMFDTGWQFQMTMQSALTVDAAKAASPAK